MYHFLKRSFGLILSNKGCNISSTLLTSHGLKPQYIPQNDKVCLTTNEATIVYGELHQNELGSPIKILCTNFCKYNVRSNDYVYVKHEVDTSPITVLLTSGCVARSKMSQQR